LASLHQQGVPHRSVLAFSPTEALSHKPTPSNSADSHPITSQLEGWGEAEESGEMFPCKKERQLGQTD